MLVGHAGGSSSASSSSYPSSHAAILAPPNRPPRAATPGHRLQHNRHPSTPTPTHPIHTIKPGLQQLTGMVGEEVGVRGVGFS